jgi:hypothetical protein
MTRIVLTVILLPLGVFAAWLGIDMLAQLASGEGDNSNSTYLMIGVPAVLFAIATFVGLIGLWRGRPRF